ncbi:MAG: HAD family hydrolase [Nanoarchaeota archaeon]|nr:HAD family hydrolase [Nanoarchaeota archaeon]
MKESVSAKDISAVSFDLDGTILRREFDFCLWGEGGYEGTLWKFVGKHLGCKPAEAYRLAAQLIPQVNCGRISVKSWINHYGLKESEGEILARVEEPLRLYVDYTPNLIKILRAHNLRVLLLTESSGELLNKKLDDTGIRGDFDQIYSSVEICNDEKCPAFYEHVLREERLPAQRVIHFGDSVTKDYQIPRSLEMRAFLLHRSNGLNARVEPGHQINYLYQILELIK